MPCLEGNLVTPGGLRPSKPGKTVLSSEEGFSLSRRVQEETLPVEGATAPTPETVCWIACGMPPVR